MNRICSICAATLLLAAILVSGLFSGTLSAVPQDPASGSNGTAVVSTTILPQFQGTVHDDPTQDYCFDFIVQVSLTDIECCEGEFWTVEIDLWEDDTWSDDYVGKASCSKDPLELPGLTTEIPCDAESPITIGCPNFCLSGEEYHDACGTGGDWEFELRVTTGTDCGTEEIDPASWDLDVPNAP